MEKQILDECKSLCDYFVIDISDKLKEIETLLDNKYQLREKQKIELFVRVDENDNCKIIVNGVSTKFDGELTQMDMFFKLK